MCAEASHASVTGAPAQAASSSSPTNPFLTALKWILEIPRLLLMGFLKLYRLIISPTYGDVCGYFPSCSAYALEAVTVHGATRGSWLAARRLLRCNPWGKGGIDMVPPGKRIWPEGKTPKIIVLNHPPIPDDIDESAAADRGA
ncbi:hypothetical protein HD598_001499 [Neomicrococcus aestuarii]|uniref:Putative membrane protein insertion efficiency factor n=1 Tax=Neomicrococcus aestuarii TaxID=556325 RepID=A0A7W8X023_9MICC|nr:membrane protein insertion efficiency factor YidD [Neomicrococcus aestuarii]MBB5512812.1 hypothetical protein [Neomicrococcus aestuarii]